MSVNRVTLIGRLGNDPEVRVTTSGASVANFNVATNETWTDREGQKQERTEWHRAVVWGKQADLARQYLSKGRQVYLEGSLQTRSWEDNTGNKRYTTEVKVQVMQFLGGASDAPRAPRTEMDAPQQQNQSFTAQQPAAAPQMAPAASKEPSFTDDDIPF